MRLSLITPYRDRLPHLRTQLAWWQRFPVKESVEWIVVDLIAASSTEDAASTPLPVASSPIAPLPIDVREQLSDRAIQYIPMPCDGPFHKTKALNLGLARAQGQLVAAFDVDLIPLGETLMRHCELAEASPRFLVTGHRLMAQTETVEMDALSATAAAAALGPEDQPSALRKYLLEGERFGVMPLFWRDRLHAIHGWDETYVGWGAEDQDLMERYLAGDRALCRCPDLTYLHLHHDAAAGWSCETLTQKNRAHYYKRRR